MPLPEFVVPGATLAIRDIYRPNEDGFGFSAKLDGRGSCVLVNIDHVLGESVTYSQLARKDEAGQPWYPAFGATELHERAIAALSLPTDEELTELQKLDQVV